MLKYLNFYNSKKTESASFELSYDAQDKTIHLVMFNNSETTEKIARIYSISSCKIVEKTITDTITNLPASKMASGIYLVCISGNRKLESKKIIVL